MSEKELIDTLHLIRKNETNYDTRYPLVLKAMYLAAALGYETGIRVDDKTDRLLWWVVYIVLPNNIGEISWHNPSKLTVWSGYDTNEKYDRCERYEKMFKN